MKKKCINYFLKTSIRSAINILILKKNLKKENYGNKIFSKTIFAKKRNWQN